MSYARTNAASNRIHIGLAISDLEASILFFSALFAAMRKMQAKPSTWIARSMRAAQEMRNRYHARD
jgi:hypothetical protein